ncbi:TonB-dependent receptor [Christiangramia fulva]|nr:TonB-dependent receptor [Christiangramia fulva]
MFSIYNHSFAQESYFTLKGKIINKNGKGIADANVLLNPGQKGTTTDGDGNFEIQRIPAGTYTLKISHVSYASFAEKFSHKKAGIVNRVITLKDTTETLQDINISARNSERSVSFLPQVKGTNIYAGKKNEVIYLQNENIDLAENNPRQIFAKIPGVSVWEMDGTGNQVSIATRGLNPHRSWEMNVRQNGNVINSDLFGYPESHYNPPSEAVQKIELIRGSGALQYGPQFGGMLNYVLKEADTTKKIGFETQQSAGSFGLFSSFNAIGGKEKKLTYYGYYNFRRSEGWRENSDYNFTAWHAGLSYAFNKRVNLSASLSHMEYVNHFAAGLTDAMFRENPRQSNRPRNYFNPTIYVPAIHLEIQAAKNTLITASTSAIFGQRNSVQFITLPTFNDTINTATNQYNPRQVDRDYYHSYSAEVRLRQDYRLFGNQNHLLTGVRYGNSKTFRRQKGEGTTGTDFDLSLTSDYKVDLTFKTLNYAFFAENVFNFTSRFSVTPGFRFDYISTDLTGEITAFDTPSVPFALQRQFPLFGIGAQYDLTPHINAYANFTQAYRPVLHSDILPASPLDRTDPDLKDARGNNSEIGLRGSLKNILQWDVNYFQLRYNDRIGTLIKDENGETYFYKTNIGDMLNQGMEAYIEFHPFALMGTASRPDISVFTSTAYNSARYTSGSVSSNGENVNISGNRIENVPHWISRNGINYSYKNISAGLQGSFVSKAYSDALNTASSINGVNGIIPSYFLLDFNFSYEFNRKYNVKFSLNNLTDEKYFTRRATGYPGPGILPSDGTSFLISFGAKI